MLCVACTKNPIRPMSEELYQLKDVECVCQGISEEQAEHLILIGDYRLQRLLEDREWCIERGLLKE